MSRSAFRNLLISRSSPVLQNLVCALAYTAAVNKTYTSVCAIILKKDKEEEKEVEKKKKKKKKKKKNNNNNNNNRNKNKY